MGLRALIGLLTALLIGGCATGQSPPESPPDPPAYDLAPPDEGKADGYVFDSGLLISDALFLDWGFMDADEIQAFLEDTPYGSRSFLADYRHGTTTVAQHIAKVAKVYEINPMILLVKLQVETSMIFKTAPPSAHTLDRATGCGCPDDHLGCFSSDAGLLPQIECTGRLLYAYLEQIETRGTTVSGWGPNKTKITSDGLSITPRSAATAALYTYTPWVLQGRGGNWLLWNVYRKYSMKVQRKRPNHRWIGGPCEGPSDCGFDDAVCLPGYRGGLGTCTLACDRVCPDNGGLFTATTFCIDSDGLRRATSDGVCMAQCDPSLFPDGDGCREDHECKRLARYGDTDVSRTVCVPGHHDGVSLEEPDDEPAPEAEPEDDERADPGPRGGPHGR